MCQGETATGIPVVEEVAHLSFKIDTLPPGVFQL